MVLGIQTLKTQHWTEVSWQNNVDNAKLSVTTLLDNDFQNRKNVFPMLITVSTLMSLLQLIKRFKLYVVKTRKLTLFSLGNID